MEFPEPVIELSVEPKTKADQEKMGVALNRLSAEDPSFRVSTDHESGQTIIKGMGELHLDIIVDRMRREFKVEANVGAAGGLPRISRQAVDIDYTHKKQSGGTGQFGRVKVKVTPGERGSGFVFKDEIKGGNIPKEYIPAIEKGLRETAATGSLSASRSSTSKVLYDGAYHDVDSSALAFEIAARGAMREVAQKAGIKLLEPIMKVEVVTPEEFMGDVIGDLNSRRGQIQGTDSRGNAQVVEATPLANMFGYVNSLRSFTRAVHSTACSSLTTTRFPNVATAEGVDGPEAGSLPEIVRSISLPDLSDQARGAPDFRRRAVPR
jgi:elongation factor G